MSATRQRWISVDGVGWACERPGKVWYAEHDGVRYTLSRRTRNPKDECPDTGWYLTGPDDEYGEFMGAGLRAAAAASNDIVVSGWADRLGGAA